MSFYQEPLLGTVMVIDDCQNAELNMENCPIFMTRKGSNPRSSAPSLLNISVTTSIEDDYGELRIHVAPHRYVKVKINCGTGE